MEGRCQWEWERGERGTDGEEVGFLAYSVEVSAAEGEGTELLVDRVHEFLGACHSAQGISRHYRALESEERWNAR